jgi:hypothetical protein
MKKDEPEKVPNVKDALATSTFEARYQPTPVEPPMDIKFATDSWKQRGEKEGSFPGVQTGQTKIFFF